MSIDFGFLAWFLIFAVMFYYLGFISGKVVALEDFRNKLNTLSDCLKFIEDKAGEE